MNTCTVPEVSSVSGVGGGGGGSPVVIASSVMADDGSRSKAAGSLQKVSCWALSASVVCLVLGTFALVT